MTMNELKERLQILLEQNVITQKDYEITTAAFEKLLKYLNKERLKQAEMLFTHLPTALSRIESGEKIEKPDDILMDEVEKSRDFPLVKDHISFIEERWERPLPEAEKEFLYMHYVNVINLNNKGDE